MDSTLKKRKWFVATIVVVVFSVAAAGCIGFHVHRHPESRLAYVLFKCGIRIFEPSFTDKQEGVALFGEFRSYCSLAGVTNHYFDRVWTQTRPLTNAVYRCRVKSCSDLGEEGDLVCFFFNDRLLATVFYPNQPERYFAALEKEKGLVFDESRAVRLGPFLKVERTSTNDTQQCVSWVDERLSKQERLWRWRYPDSSPKTQSFN